MSILRALTDGLRITVPRIQKKAFQTKGKLASEKRGVKILTKWETRSRSVKSAFSWVLKKSSKLIKDTLDWQNPVMFWIVIQIGHCSIQKRMICVRFTLPVPYSLINLHISLRLCSLLRKYSLLCNYLQSNHGTNAAVLKKLFFF